MDDFQFIFFILIFSQIGSFLSIECTLKHRAPIAKSINWIRAIKYPKILSTVCLPHIKITPTHDWNGKSRKKSSGRHPFQYEFFLSLILPPFKQHKLASWVFWLLMCFASYTHRRTYILFTQEFSAFPSLLFTSYIVYLLFCFCFCFCLWIISKAKEETKVNFLCLINSLGKSHRFAPTKSCWG